jgi:hypothetical protein
MSTTSTSYSSAQPRKQALPGLPRGPLTPEQQLEALQRVQNQAEQRVKLGLQLFKAAEAHTLGYQKMIDTFKAEHETFRDELAQDVTRSLREFDQWIGTLDDTFTEAVLALETRLNNLEARLDAEQQKMESMLRRSEALLQQAQAMLEGSKPASE